MFCQFMPNEQLVLIDNFAGPSGAEKHHAYGMLCHIGSTYCKADCTNNDRHQEKYHRTHLNRFKAS
jgi:hypothetical protein